MLEIRPLWDWNKDAFWLTCKTSHLRNSLKSDHYGIEMRYAPVGAMREIPWNQTTMGLKLGTPLFVSFWFKSWNQTTMGLKWTSALKPSLINPLEIRPLWDWNHDFLACSICSNVLKSDHYGIEMNFAFIPSPLSFLLKSDHYGIEIKIWNIGKERTTSWNQTTMGLKCCRPIIYDSDNILEIRPLWDWNIIDTKYKIPDLPSWNQTTMGLKFSLFIECIMYCTLEIRPLWDWNSFSYQIDQNGETLEIRPLWDWNSLLFSQKLPTTAAWNQTTMGLKFEYCSLTIVDSFNLKSDQFGNVTLLCQSPLAFLF